MSIFFMDTIFVSAKCSRSMRAVYNLYMDMDVHGFWIPLGIAWATRNGSQCVNPHVCPWWRTQVLLIGDRYKGNYLSNKSYSFVYFKSLLMKRGRKKFEPNSYIDEYRYNWIFWRIIHLNIDKTIHYFLKLNLSPSWIIYLRKLWTKIEEFAPPISKYFVIASLQCTSLLVYLNNR